MAIKCLRPPVANSLDPVCVGECRRCKAQYQFNKSDCESWYDGDQREPGKFGNIPCPTKGCGATVTGYPVP